MACREYTAQVYLTAHSVDVFAMALFSIEFVLSITDNSLYYSPCGFRA
jgi:hypothetical protein